MNSAYVQQALSRLSEQIGRVVMGAEIQTRLGFVALLVRGHLLLEGVPGTGKTLFARCFARSLGLEMRRLQCTPDLMPGDVLGANIFDFRAQTFALTKGPVFCEFLLADEVNRTPPKTQSALLEAMQERSVTIDGTTHPLSPRFMVVATQNPIEHEGTYPLPEAQLDRFLFKLLIGYPGRDEEYHAVMAHCSSAGAPDLDQLGIAPILSPQDLDALRAVPAAVRMEPNVAGYAVLLARATREHEALSVGLSPRASTMLAAAARAQAACEGRDYTLPDDVKQLFAPVARHRVTRTPTAEMEGRDLDSILEEVVSRVQAPR
jgi:MoxR-like ATPase